MSSRLVQRLVFKRFHNQDLQGTLCAGIVVHHHAQVDFAYIWNRQFVASAGVRF
jgi:hypothetical protein